jgi:broad specificity phosphatase PhoE
MLMSVELLSPQVKRIVPASEDQPFKIILVRHGQSIANEKKLIAGSTDFPLSETGRGEAKAKEAILGPIPDTVPVFSSNLQRASETGLILAKREPFTSPLLQERHFGALEATPITEEVIHFLSQTPYADRCERKLPGAEDMETDIDILLRWGTFLDEVEDTLQGNTTLIASHGSFMATVFEHIEYNNNTKVTKVGNVAHMVLTGDTIYDLQVAETVGIETVQL